MRDDTGCPPNGWRISESEIPNDLTITAAFDRWIAATPDAIALKLGDASGAPGLTMTYSELSERANALANSLVEAGVAPGDCVAFTMNRSFDFIVAMLGILKAGAAYLPLDTSYPEQRLAYILGDASVRVLVTPPGGSIDIADTTLRIVETSAATAREMAHPPAGDRDDPAYVVYTSGSTGQPKGVIAPHRAVLRLVQGVTYTPLDADRTVLQMAPVSFDAATFEIWGALLNGGTCVLYPQTGLPDFEQLRGVLAGAGVNTLWLTSSLFNAVVDHDVTILAGVEELLIGGEALSLAHVRAANAKLKANIINGYGPTETTTFACCYRIPRDLPEDLVSVPIGKPIENTAVAILDEHFNPVPDGTSGELCIAGDGLAIGYLNQPELTSDRFVEHAQAPGGRFYRTGDRARILASGDVEFQGRSDSQVKIGGHRIELGEIEHAIRAHSKLRDAAVAVDEPAEGAQRLVAWVVPRDCTDAPTGEELRSFAESWLPRFMVPSVYSALDKLPLTENGKLDRRALPAPRRERPALEQAYAAPRGAQERFVADAWSELLGLESVGRKDRFFELGGTSLLAMRFLEVCRRSGGFSISVSEFFDGPTVENIAKLAAGQADAADTAAPVVERQATDGRVAIIGVAGRFPGAPDIDSFWEMLLEGRSGRVEVMRDDLVAAGQDPALLDDPDFVAAAFPLADAEAFDAAFFGYNPREAALMDPQQRILLECAWTALENAGYDPHRVPGRVGVFGGVGRNAYLLNNLMSHKALRDTAADYNMLIGNERDFPCAHIAYRLGLNGPAVTVQTACSTSGVATHMAAQTLLRGECDLALAGGAKILVPNRSGYRYVEGGPLAPDGMLRAFDANAKGMVRGSGAAMVALKRLDDALEDGDHIYAVMLGSALNNDGDARAGFTAPSATGQARVIAEAHRNAGVKADSISLIEAHGTGTVLGDPIEVEGLTRAFRATTEQSGFCALGSVKTNIGHLDAGATAAGVIKAALALDREVIPPSLNFSAPNPSIDFANTPFFVAGDGQAWKRGATPRRAGVSSFGLGGTNAHLVLEEAPARPASDPAAGPQLLTLSARSKTALARRCDDLADWLEQHADANLADVAYTLLVGRHRFEESVAMICEDRADAIAKLRERRPQELLRPGMAGEDAPVAFLFPGGGAQYGGMARAQYRDEPEFRRVMDACSTHFERRTGQSLVDLIYENSEPIEQPSVALPALFAVEFAMASLWKSWGVEPGAMIGHSMGEYTAACLAGVFSMEDAIDVVLCRGRLFETLEGGSMLSVPLSETVMRERLGGTLSIAAINRENQCVISGPTAAIEALGDELATEGVETRRVHINVAAHSTLVEPILDAFRDELQGIDLHPPKLPFVSNLTGDWITDDQATNPDYWVQHLRSTVRFSDGVARLFEEEECILVEIGPGQSLSSLARQHTARGAGHEVIASVRHPQQEIADDEFLLSAVGRFWLAGGVIGWKAVAGGSRRRIALPTYPFERVRHWIDAVPDLADGAGAALPYEPAPAEAEAPDGTEPEAEPATRHERILAQLKAIIHQLSGLPLERIDEHATFLELGFDSLFLTQANAAFKKAFKIRMTTRQLIEATPVLEALAAHIDKELAPDAEFGAAPAPAPTGAPTAGAPAAAGASPGQTTVHKAAAGELTPEQERHIQELIATTNARTPKTKEATQASRAILADPRTVQGFRSSWKEMVYPVLSDRAEGSKIWDVDGNEYIDLVCGYGATMFGHRPQFIIDAVQSQLDKSLAIGPQTVLASQVAGLVSDMTGMERVAFCNTGSEAVLAAVRMARTVTGKSKIAKFDGHYHGIFDEMQVRGSGKGSRRTTLPGALGIPQEAIQNTVILEYGDEEAFEVLREQADELALVLVEPVRSRNPDYQPREYLQKLRRITEELGIPLLFDEIVTGFRSHPGGAQAIFDVRADLATYGKVAGGGLPIGIVTGSATFMDTLDGGNWQFGDDTVPTADMTWFAGTFVRHPLALASTRATLEHLKAEGPALQEQLNSRTAALAAKLNALFEHLQTPLRAEHFSSFLYIGFTRFQEYSDLLFFHLRNRGILTYEGRPAFLTTAHSDEDFQKIHDAFADSLKALLGVGLVEGHDPDATRRIPLTTGQQEIWVSAQFSPEASCSYNLCSTLMLDGQLDPAHLQAALNDLAARHEALRATPERDGFMQVIHPRVNVPLTIEDLRADDATRDERIAAIRREEVTAPFDLINGPLVRARLMHLADGRHMVLLTVHHVIADGWSCGVLLRDLGALYAAHQTGRAPVLEPTQQLSDFVNFLRGPEQLESRKESRDYWLELYGDEFPRLQFPSDRPRPKQRDYAANRCEMPLDPKDVENLRRVALNSGTTLFASLIGGFAAYVTRLTGVARNPIGFSAAGQPLLGGAGLVGHCVNFLPLLLETDPDKGFADHLRNIGASVLDALEHQNFDFLSFVQEMQPERDADWAPLVSVGVNLDPSSKGVEFADFHVTAGSVGRAYENLDLFLNFVENDDGVELQCTYNTALYDEATIQMRLREYLRLLSKAAAEPDAPLGTLDVLGDADRKKILTEWNDTACDYPKDTALGELFRDCARAHGDRTALASVDGENAVRDMTYAELDHLSDRWASELRGAGIKPGDFVALLLPRSPDFIVSLLAVVKAGAAYVPIEPDTPARRRDFMLQDSGAAAVITVDAFADSVGASGIRVLVMDRVADQPDKATSDAPVQVTGRDPAYMMYTSGSTGTPKGVVVPHRAVARLVIGSSFARLDQSRVLAQLAPRSFDASTFEIWGALLHGAKLVLPPGDALPQLSALADLLKANGVTTLWLTASLFNTIIDEDPQILSSVDEVLTGGEALSVAHIRRALTALPDTTLINGYGPTENTTFTCCYKIPRDFDGGAASVPIGRPVANTQAYIVDTALELAPIGVPGELLIGGDGLALEYWNRDDLNARAFVPDRIGDSAGTSDRRLYRTGDYCRYLPDGTIEFLGRHDDQIKIRGFRIELGEVETALLAIEGVRKAVVLYERTGDSGRLVAFAEPASEAISPASLTRALRDQLPRHLLPSQIMVLAALPISQNGKVDRQALVEMAGQEAEPAGAIAPETDTEKALAEIWGDVLKRTDIGVTDSFFSLGGHSLMAVRLFDRIRRRFGPDLPISTLFSRPSVRDLAEIIDEEAGKAAARVEDEGPEAQWDTSAVIHPGPAAGGEPALFIVGGAGGNVNNLVEFGAALGVYRPVVGFQARGILGHTLHDTIEDMATDHIRNMRRHQPMGPYHLAGYSAGAQIAFEMARQLAAAGETVARLVLLDTYAPGFAGLVQTNVPVRLTPRQRLKNELQMLRDHGAPHLLQRVRAKLGSLLLRGKMLDATAMFNLSLSRRVRTSDALLAAARTYEGGPYHGPVSLVLAGPESLRDRMVLAAHPMLGWDRHVDEEMLERHEVATGHLDMVKGDHARELAEYIEARIRSAGAPE